MTTGAYAARTDRKLLRSGLPREARWVLEWLGLPPRFDAWGATERR